MAAAAFVLTLGLGYPVLAYLRRAGVAKQVRADELPSHFGKTGTPTMGGLMFIGPIVALTIVLALTWLRESGRSVLLPTCTMLVAASTLRGPTRSMRRPCTGAKIAMETKLIPTAGIPDNTVTRMGAETFVLP